MLDSQVKGVGSCHVTLHATYQIITCDISHSNTIVTYDISSHTDTSTGIQVFQNTDKVCPERHGGKNNTKLYIDSSEPVPGGGGMWKNDTTIKFECYKKEMTPTQECSCSKYKVYHTVYQNGSVPKAVDYLSGTFVKVEDKKDTYGLLAPLYR